MKTLYTIGFTKKNLKDFVFLLKNNTIRMVVDVRLKNSSQLAGFAKGEDLKFLLEELLDIRYIHIPLFSPDEKIFTQYRKDKDWEKYQISFEKLMQERGIESLIRSELPDPDGVCLLCSEDLADHCHRRLIAEKIQTIYPEVCIIHLTSEMGL
jgi:uncharacterized protein (DUF488 family)